ncbi:nucleotide-diphospho-sugar transferase [Microdochium trichocladiopsis]|uniref:Nucleotide-diphospho-sugar transferase n=1 Tax=Microdochium trichocladiopsis TaxID=1682393 RepID=A0A9P8Y5X6_9PEZI|nr:nucleotide-diphospho-sugar transferase [Microdochium trichocladiopsis]KAH7032670.1 nucleotide-diphospho-sugar transferase [Microdochium trichocladiopsis]
MWSCLYLVARCTLGIYDDHLRFTNASKCTPLALASGRAAFSTKDVSLLVPTIDTPDDFVECIKSWLANSPREVIIVTVTRDLQRLNELLALAGLRVSSNAGVPISVITVPRPGRREQMVVALRKATGKIVAWVDDDTYWPSDKVLPHLLAGFEDHRVGGAGGKQSAFVPPERRDANVITPSEVASIRAINSFVTLNAAEYARAGVVWCLAGRTLLARAAAVQTDDFCHALTHETWMGQKINTGDDGFVTHYLLRHGWRLAFQSAPEAEVLTRVEPAAGSFVKQLVRWRRSGYRSFLALVLDWPGFSRVYAEYPRFALSVVRYLLKPVSVVVHTVAWIHAFWVHPKFA